MIRAIKRLWRWVWRSSQTGRFVPRSYAEAHPDVTQKERVE